MPRLHDLSLLALRYRHLLDASSGLDGDGNSLGPWSYGAHPSDKDIDGYNIFTTQT